MFQVELLHKLLQYTHIDCNLAWTC